MLRLLNNWYGKRLSNRYASAVKARLTEEEWLELLEMSRSAQGTDPLFGTLTQSATSLDISPIEFARLTRTLTTLRKSAEFDAAMTPESILGNPALNPYRRSAFRLLPSELRSTLMLTPIVVTPRFRFEGFAGRFRCSHRKLVEIPFGVIFVLRPIAEVSLGTYLSDSPEKSSALSAHLDALRLLATELDAATPSLFSAVIATIGPHCQARLGVAHYAHLMGIFMLLHELGHIGRSLDPR